MIDNKYKIDLMDKKFSFKLSANYLSENIEHFEKFSKYVINDLIKINK